MKRQFVSEVGVFASAWNSKKAEDLVAFVKRYEHALLSDDVELPAKVLSLKIKKLCASIDQKFSKTLPLLVDLSRNKRYGGMMSQISVKPSRRDGSFSDSYWVIMTLIDVKTDFDLNKDPIKEESTLANILAQKGGEQ